MATLTVYASPNAYMFNTNAVWATLRADGTSVGYDTTSATEAVLIGEFTGGNYNLARNIYIFDTSALTSGVTINSAVFSVKSTTSAGNGTEVTNPANGSLVGVVGTPDGNTSDFGKFGTTRFCDTDVTRANFANGAATYKDWTLNATGLAAINKTGNTNLGIRMSNDYSDLTIPVARSFAIGYFAADATQTNRPKLVIDYTASSLKTWNGIPVADIKTFNGVPIASVKSINGIT